MSYVLGIDLGGTRIKVAAFALDGSQVLWQRTMPTGDREKQGDRPAWAARIASMVACAADELGGQAATRIGLAAPGLAATDERSIASMPGRLAGLENFDWTNFLGRSERVPVLNDAHAALLGEVWQGAARGCRNVVQLTLGTGVGGAIMADGKLLRGALGRAGHMGHVCLNMRGHVGITGIPGSLEECVGDCSVSRRSGGRFAKTAEVVEACDRGDAGAKAMWAETVEALACAIASFINIVDPERIVIGGGIAQAGDALFGPLDAALSTLEWRPAGHRVPVVPAALPALAGAYGAAYRALNTVS